MDARDEQGKRRLKLLLAIFILGLVIIFLVRGCLADWLERSLYGQ